MTSNDQGPLTRSTGLGRHPPPSEFNSWIPAYGFGTTDHYSRAHIRSTSIWNHLTQHPEAWCR